MCLLLCKALPRHSGNAYWPRALFGFDHICYVCVDLILSFCVEMMGYIQDIWALRTVAEQQLCAIHRVTDAALASYGVFAAILSRQ